MRRASLVDVEHVPDELVPQIYSTAVAMRNRDPSSYDAWYMSGLCSLIAGDRLMALHELGKAAKLGDDDDKAKEIFAELGGDEKKMWLYAAYAWSSLHSGFISSAIIFAIILAIVLSS